MTMPVSPKLQVSAKIQQAIKKFLPKPVFRLLRSARERLFTWRAQQNYRQRIRELSQRKDKIKVVFLVSQSAKWNGDSLYRKLEVDSRFSPIVLYSPLEHASVNLDSDVRTECRFFEEQGYNFATFSNVSEFLAHKPDVVFYQQPWDALSGDFTPVKLSQYALCLYFPYSTANCIENQDTWYWCSLFYNTVYGHFVINTAVVEQFNARGTHNVIATGHPKMDVYLEPVKTNPWKDKEKYKIIYAPHHSFGEARGLWATFDWNGRELLEWAKAHSNTTEWIFKPHPDFRYAVLNTGRMTIPEIDEYYNEWNHVGSVYTLGNYFDIFRTADLLITDCGSFVTEWLPTEKPCIHLLSDKEVPNTRSIVHENSSRHYYKVKNLEDLLAAMEMLVVRREDPLAEARIQDAKNMPLDSAKNIHQWLIETIWRKNDEK